MNLFASEVTRVAHEVGTEGKLGAQAKVAGVNGIWKELTDNVNIMATNLTNQVRDIAHVSKSVARGDLSKKVQVEVKGEMLDLKNTINTMVDQVSLWLIISRRYYSMLLSFILVINICRGSYSRIFRSWYGRKTRRSGYSERCWWYLERFNR